MANRWIGLRTARSDELSAWCLWRSDLLNVCDSYLSDVSSYRSKYGHLLRECLLLIVTTDEWTMRKTTKSPGEKIVKDIKRATCKQCSSEEKIRVDLSRFCAAPSARLGHFPLEGDGAFPAIADPPILGQIYPSWWTTFRGQLRRPMEISSFR